MELSSDASNKAWDLSIAATFPSLPVPALPGIQAKAEKYITWIYSFQRKSNLSQLSRER